MILKFRFKPHTRRAMARSLVKDLTNVGN